MFRYWFQYKQVSGTVQFPTLDAATDWAEGFLNNCPGGTIRKES